MIEELMNKGIDKNNVKNDLISFFSALRDAEERAMKLYDEMLKTNSEEMNAELVGIITGIRNDEVSHMKMAETLLSTIKNYDFKLELLVFKLP